MQKKKRRTLAWLLSGLMFCCCATPVYAGEEGNLSTTEEKEEIREADYLEETNEIDSLEQSENITSDDSDSTPMYRLKLAYEGEEGNLYVRYRNPDQEWTEEKNFSEEEILLYGKEEVELRVQPEEGFLLDECTISTEETEKIEYIITEDERYSFTMPENNVMVSVSFCKTEEQPESLTSKTSENEEMEEELIDDALEAVEHEEEASLKSEQTEPDNTGIYINEFFGVKSKDLQSWLKEKQSNYIGTRYVGTGYSKSYFAPNTPISDPRYENGYGLNCGSFVARVFWDVAHNGKIPDDISDYSDYFNSLGIFDVTYNDIDDFENRSPAWLTATDRWGLSNQEVTNHFTYYYAESYDSMLSLAERLRKEGILTNGAIIMSKPTSTNVDRYGNNADTHIGFYYNSGDAPVSSQSLIYWNSTHVTNGLGSTVTSAGNQISNITGKCENVVWFIFPLSPSTGEITILKKSAEANLTAKNSNYSLEGAVYGVYADNTCENQIDTLTTGADGNALSSVKVEAGTYYIKEITASKGYLLDETIYSIAVSAGQTEKVTVEETPEKALPGLLLSKEDSESGKALSGAYFEVKYYAVETEDEIRSSEAEASWILKTDEKGEIFLDENHKVSGDEVYVDKEGKTVLPLGFVTIQETKAPTGYLLNETLYVCPVSLENEEVKLENLPSGENAVKEDLIRGDLDFTKISAEDGKRMAGVSFEIKNLSTGESHTIVTDENGFASTSAAVNEHSSHTNEGEKSSDGIWFGELTCLDNSKGALPYGDYLITEIPSSENYGFRMLSFSVSIRENNVVLHLGEIENQPIEIYTNAKSKQSGNQFLITGKTETVIDEISYKNLTKGKSYRFSGKILDLENRETVAESEFEFIPQESDGSVEMSFTVDSEKAVGKKLVVTEVLYEDGIERAKHEDLTDKKQTLYIPKIETNASDYESGSSQGSISENCILQDTISYKGLKAGVEYTVKGRLIDKESGQAFCIDGKEVTAEKSFIPENSSGTIIVEFSFDSNEAIGKSLVVYETLYYGEMKLAAHEELENENQTVTYPEKLEQPQEETPKQQTDTAATGDHNMGSVSGLIALFILSILGAGAIVAAGRRKRNK